MNEQTKELKAANFLCFIVGFFSGLFCSVYATREDRAAARIALLAAALEQEAKAQFKDPSKLKFFTTENEA